MGEKDGSRLLASRNIAKTETLLYLLDFDARLQGRTASRRRYMVSEKIVEPPGSKIRSHLR